MRHYRTGPIPCPFCGYMNDEQTNLHDPATANKPPKAGDFGVCANCRCVSVFTADGLQRRPTESELALVASDPRLTVAAMAAHLFAPKREADQ
jgi:hypothetical protein